MPRIIPRALSAGEERAVLEVLHEPRFADLAPAQVYATLLDEQRYLCSERTMYRVLAHRARGAILARQPPGLHQPHDRLRRGARRALVVARHIENAFPV
jgi:hypothetical protein